MYTHTNERTSKQTDRQTDKRTNNFITTPLDASPPICAEPTWKIQGNRCYRYLPYGKGENYQYANFLGECKKVGGELARIDNAKQNAFVNSMVPSNGNNGQSIVIGLNDRITEGEYKWADGTTPVYLNWDADQPDNWEDSKRKDGEDCITMRKSNGKWNDVGCGIFYNREKWDIITHFVCSANVVSTGKHFQSAVRVELLRFRVLVLFLFACRAFDCSRC